MKHRVLLVSSLAIISVYLISTAFAQESRTTNFGKYSCMVERGFPEENEWVRSYLGIRLEFDADKGTLDSADPIEIEHEVHWSPPQRINNRLEVQNVANAKYRFAVQFDTPGPLDSRPYVAWMKIENPDNKFAQPLAFKYFSSGLEGIIEGKCTHLP